MITKLTFTECDIPPPVAEIASGYVPVVAGFFTETVNFELPDPTIAVGLKEELVREGRPVTLRLIVAEKGPRAETVTV